MAAKKDTPAPRSRTQVRIVNLRMNGPDEPGPRRWTLMPKEHASSADALKAQLNLGPGTYQVAHLFGQPRTLRTVEQPALLVVDDGEIDEPTAPEADDDD